jgi:hypothetical protein
MRPDLLDRYGIAGADIGRRQEPGSLNGVIVVAEDLTRVPVPKRQ